jgi:hypothetical protein
MHAGRHWIRLGLAGPLVVLFAGCQDQATEPAATVVAPTGAATCGQSCELAGDAAVLGAARLNPDSARVPVVLARVSVTGRAGHTVRLGLVSDGPVRTAIPASQRLTVVTPNGSRSWALRDLGSSVEIYRFSVAQTVTLTYTLNRQMGTVPAGAFRLVQSLEGASVAEAELPWRRSMTTAPTLAATAAGPCTGSVTAPASNVCGVAYTAAPFAPGGLGGTFGSDPCCGPSHDVVLTFAPGVSSVTATIFDPTYAGNRMVATDENGALVGSADFAFTNQPGNNVPDTKTISVGGVTTAALAAAAAPAGIARVDLIASTGIAEGDYISWTVTFTVTPQEIDVTCTGSGGVRGASISCEAKPHDETATLAVTGWTFVSTDGDEVSRGSDVTSTTWAGELWIGGQVTATGTVNGTEASGKATVTIQPRDWSDKTTPGNHTTPGADGLPPRPTAFEGQLGLTSLSLEQRQDVANYLGLVSDGGPNEGFAYMTDIPFRTVTVSRVNYPAMQQGSDWYQIQETRDKKKGQVTYCGQPRVLTLPPLVEAHEGTNPPAQPLSHSGIYIADVTRDARTATEALVGPGSTLDLTPTRNTLHTSAAADSRAMDNDARNNLNSTTIPCVFQFDYSRLR